MAAKSEALACLKDLVDAVNEQAATDKTYAGAVGFLAEFLRPRFESGELRGFIDADDQRPAGWDAPMHRVERACERHFIRSPEAALLVLTCAGKTKGHQWSWNQVSSHSMRGAASARMAADVLDLARARGWSRPQPMEDPAPRRKRSA